MANIHLEVYISSAGGGKGWEGEQERQLLEGSRYVDRKHQN